MKKIYSTPMATFENMETMQMIATSSIKVGKDYEGEIIQSRSFDEDDDRGRGFDIWEDNDEE
jgi:hypothetical protein